MHDTITADRVHTGLRLGICGFRGTFTEASVTAVTHHTNHLGGRYATVTVQLPDGDTATVDTRQHVLVTPEYQRTAWCPECRRTRDVDDISPEAHMTRAGEVAHSVTYLDCGHTVTGPETVVGAAPGAPYAGPGVAVAATTSPRDLRAARARQDALDHPYGSEHDQ